MKTIRSLLLLSAGCAIIYSCDKVNGPFKEEVVVNDFCKTGIADSVVHKKVLVEDYTGHTCGNCPAAGLLLNETLKESYGHCLVVLSVHASEFADTCPGGNTCPGGAPPGSFAISYKTVPGEEWNSFFGVAAYPTGMVDRIGYSNGTHVKPYSAWSTAIASEVAKEADVKIQITNNFNTLTRSLSTSVESEFLSDVTGNYKLQVVLSEDSIMDWQVWYGHNPEYVPDYVHHHVLRDALNSTWGETIVTGGATTGTSITKSYTYNVNTQWNSDYCYVVAFVYNASTYEVLQVEESKIR